MFTKMESLKKSVMNIAAAAIVAGALVSYAPAASAAPADEALPEMGAVVMDLQRAGAAIFPVGVPNSGLADVFTGKSYISFLETKGVNVAKVTFEPGCINQWHRHHGSCQVLAGVSGKGYYQIWGEEPKELLPGESVTIPEGVKHWHGAQNGSWFQHLSIMQEGASTEWLEPVDEAEYAKLK